jgi:hypothetical protein
MAGKVPAGAYGLQIRGIPEADLVALPPGLGWTPVRVGTVVAAEPPRLHGIGAEDAAFPLLDGAWSIVDRRAGTATRGAPVPADPTVLAHPFLAGVAAVHAAWAGRFALHAGAWAGRDGRAWLLTGPSGTGKSTMLAALAGAGAPVAADDLAVLDGQAVLAGPRGVDLRPDVAEALGTEAREVRGATRRRVRLEAVDPVIALQGIVHLDPPDGRGPRLAPLRPAERLARLGREDLWAIPAPGADALLGLAALPGHVLTRPGDLAGLPGAVELLLGLG